MFVAGALCPHPPVLVPEVAVGAAGELSLLREACDRAVARLMTCHPDVVAVVGRAAESGVLPTRGGSFAAYGVPLRVGTGPTSLSLAHTVGAWLLDRAQWHGPRVHVGVDDDTAFAELAPSVSGRADRVAVLAMGDASACRSEKAPGYLDPRAADHDRAVVDAFRRGPTAVRTLDGALARDVLADGWPAWRLLAEIADGRPVHDRLLYDEPPYRTEVLYDDAPYGVGYLVVTWLPVL